jgi:hypothetical protein
MGYDREFLNNLRGVTENDKWKRAFVLYFEISSCTIGFTIIAALSIGLFGLKHSEDW